MNVIYTHVCEYYFLQHVVCTYVCVCVLSLSCPKKIVCAPTQVLHATLQHVLINHFRSLFLRLEIKQPPRAHNIFNKCNDELLSYYYYSYYYFLRLNILLYDLLFAFYYDSIELFIHEALRKRNKMFTRDIKTLYSRLNHGILADLTRLFEFYYLNLGIFNLLTH